MSGPTAELWARLKDAGLVVGEPPPGTHSAPWFVRVMLGVAGWIGASFLLGFVAVGLEVVVKSAGASLVVGLLACAAAAIFRLQPEGDFATQFGLAVSFAGQALVGYALGSWFSDQGAVALGMCLLLAALFALVSNYVHRVWSAAAGGLAALYALQDWHLLAYGPALLSAACAGVWLNEFSVPRQGAILRAAGYGLVMALIMATAAVAWDNSPRAWTTAWYVPDPAHHLWIGATLSSAVWIGAVWALFGRAGVTPASPAGARILGMALIVAAASLKAPGLAPAVLVLVLGYSHGNWLLAGLGIAALLSYLGFYYYALQLTLLQKSALLAATGVVLLAARIALHRVWPSAPHEEVRHA